MSGACCNLPPVEAEYTPKGEYIEVAGIKTYAVGPVDSKQVINLVYDVFGFSPQILQGADLLASQGFRVVMPDYLVGKYATGEMFAPGNEAKKDEYFSTFPGGVHTQSAPIAKVGAELKANGAKVGIVGYCWGWKALILSEGLSEYAAIATAHPSFIAPEDGEKVKVPICILPSKDEDKAACEAVRDAAEKAVPGKVTYKVYETSSHGWTAARGDVSGGPQTEAFADAYKTLSSFFKANL